MPGYWVRMSDVIGWILIQIINLIVWIRKIWSTVKILFLLSNFFLLILIHCMILWLHFWFIFRSLEDHLIFPYAFINTWIFLLVINYTTLITLISQFVSALPIIRVIMLMLRYFPYSMLSQWNLCSFRNLLSLVYIMFASSLIEIINNLL